MFLPGIPSRLQTDLKLYLMHVNACLLESVKHCLIITENYTKNGG